LLLAGVWNSLAVAAPTPVVLAADSTAPQANADTRWVETFGNPPPQKS